MPSHWNLGLSKQQVITELIQSAFLKMSERVDFILKISKDSGAFPWWDWLKEYKPSHT
jgi:hypothetical protein